MKQLVILLLTMPFFVMSCTTSGSKSVVLNLNPETMQNAQCPPHPNFRSFNISKIAVMNFIDSQKKPTEKFYPHPSFNIPPYDSYVYLSENDGSIAAGIAERTLISSYSFNIVDRRNIKRLIEEQQFQATGLTNQDTAIRIGKISGADAILTGEVHEAFAYFNVKTAGTAGADGFIGTYVAHVSIELRLVHVETGQVIWYCSLRRNNLNYLDSPISVTNHEILHDLHALDKPLHGSSPKERIMFVMEQAISEAIANITSM
ncbi:MAG: CsgG/HfaB family protein [Candidatus Auribacterota bacterium]|jgi:curli biogenesis system outer membrane secretion channel CsgG|nr:CsgG/HfaB family protein [Candidatus Auribacterota bacterium]